MDPDFTLILIGNSGVGKSASGNTILGSPDFFKSEKSFTSVTREICKKRGNVFGKQITVVDTPEIFGSEREIKDCCQELLQSSTPCLFLVVVKIDRFTTEQKNAVEAAIRVIGDDGFKNCYLLFTGGDDLSNMSLDDFINQDPKGPLQPIVKRFEDRYHVFNNARGGQEQVIELLEKTRKPKNVTPPSTNKCEPPSDTPGNPSDLPANPSGHLGHPSGHPLSSDGGPTNPSDIPGNSSGLPGNSSGLPGNPSDLPAVLPEMRIVLLGLPGAGKSSSGNTILGTNQFESAADFNSVSKYTVSKSATVEGRLVKVVDTPGITGKVLTPSKLFREIIKTVEEADPGPNAFIIVVKLARIIETDIKLFELLEKLFRKDASNYTVVLFTYGDELRDKHISTLIEENKYVSGLISKCDNRYCVFDNTKRGNRAQVKKLLVKIDDIFRANRREPCTSEMFLKCQTMGVYIFIKLDELEEWFIQWLRELQASLRQLVGSINATLDSRGSRQVGFMMLSN